MLVLILALALQLPPPQPDCPARITNLWLKADYRQLPHAEMQIQNKSNHSIKLVEYQLDTYDDERRVFLARYYLAVGCCYEAGFPGKPVGPGQTKYLWGGIGRILASMYAGTVADKLMLSRTVINVIHYDDGTTWERQGWRKEPNPNQ